MNLHFKIHKTELKRLDEEVLASFSRNFIQCNFECCGKWEDIYKYALFTGANKEQFVVDLGFGQEVSCKVPNEILKCNYFSVSVFGDDRLTTTQQDILILPSGFTDKTEEGLESGNLIIDGEQTTYRHRIIDESSYFRHNLFEIQEHPYY